MTPLLRLFERHLPGWMIYPTLTAVYALMLACIVLFSNPSSDAVIYIDVHY